MNDKIRQLEKQIEEEKIKIQNCKHVFGESYYNPYIEKEGYGWVQDGAGSDPHWSFAGYRDIHKPRWTRKCTLCGFEQHTIKQKPVIVGQEPDFK